MANQRRDSAKEVFWRDAIQRQAASGLSVREFCRREQLRESAFYAWRRTIGLREGAGVVAPAFVPAVVITEARGEGAIAIELAGGCVLRFSGAAAAERLAELVLALQQR